MRKVFVLGVMALLGLFVAQARAGNLLVNGNFATNDETGWTRWNSPWGGGFVWDASAGTGSLQTNNGSFGWYQAIATTPGAQYTITADFSGAGATDWIEFLFFNDDGRPVYDQIDAPLNSSVIAKVDAWGMNGGMPFGPVSITDKYYPAGLLTNTITATGTTMYVGLKAGASAGSVSATFDNVIVTPEPATMALLGLATLGLLRRRIGMPRK